MDRREFIKKTAMAGTALAAAGSFPLGAEERPNVLLVICDQLRRPRWFPKSARLPNYERLQDQGLEFTDHFASAVPCSPSRACLFTGLHMDQNQIRINVAGKYQAGLDPRLPTLGQLFRAAGYQTPYCGKWHLALGGDDPNADLSAYGFQKIAAACEKNEFKGRTCDESFTDAALSWLDQPEHQQKPWFLVLSLINPHDIGEFPGIEGVSNLAVPRLVHDLPDNWDDNLEGKPSCQSEFQEIMCEKSGHMDPDDKKAWMRFLDYYYFLNRKVDDQLGRVMKKLAATGLDQKTLFIFTSDHGEMAGSHKLRGKGPFIYAENTNVPLVVSWPGKIAGGTSSRALCQNVDLFPTLAGVLGVDAASSYPYLPGRSLVPILRNPPAAELTDHVLYSFAGNLSLMLQAKEDEDEGITGPQNIRAIRERDWVYARYFDSKKPDQEFEMYDLKNDPLEMKNLANDPSFRDKRQEMAEKLKKAEATEMAPIRK